MTSSYIGKTATKNEGLEQDHEGLEQDHEQVLIVQAVSDIFHQVENIHTTAPGEEVMPTTVEQMAKMYFSDFFDLCCKQPLEVLQVVQEDTFMTLCVLIVLGKGNEIHGIMNTLEDDQQQEMYYRLGSSLGDSTSYSIYTIELLKISTTGPNKHIAAQANYLIGYQIYKNEENDEGSIPFLMKALEEGNISIQLDAAVLLVNFYYSTGDFSEGLKIWGLFSDIENHSRNMLHLSLGEIVGEMCLYSKQFEEGISILKETLLCIGDTKNIEDIDSKPAIYIILADLYSTKLDDIIACEETERYLNLCIELDTYKPDAYYRLLYLYYTSDPSFVGSYTFEEILAKLIELDDPYFTQMAQLLAYDYYSYFGQEDFGLTYLQSVADGPDEELTREALKTLKGGESHHQLVAAALDEIDNGATIH